MNLSGGQKQRLFIALALINDPEVVFLDELTTGLDPQARRAIWELVRGIRERGKTVFMTTHLMEEAERLCDRVAIIEHGKIIDIGTPEELVRRHCPTRTVVLDTESADAEEQLRAIPVGRDGDAAGCAIHDSGARRGFGDGGDSVLVRESDPGDGFSDGAADARRCVSEADGPFDSRLERRDDAARTLEADVAGDQDLPARTARRVRVDCFPVMIFLVAGRWWGGGRTPSAAANSEVLRVEVPVFASVLIAVTRVLSLVTIISIYREGGILRRLRATPLRPQTILTAHVLVKLALTLVTMALLVLAGKRYYPVVVHVPVFSFAWRC